MNEPKWEHIGSGMYVRIAEPVKEWTKEEMDVWHAALIKEINEKAGIKSCEPTLS